MKTAKIAEFKARLSNYLNYVKKGKSLTIYDRDTPIADVIPHDSGEALRIVEADGDLYELLEELPKRSRVTKKVSSLDLLLGDRKR